MLLVTDNSERPGPCQDVDLVVVETTQNDAEDAPYASPERRGYEQLLRGLLALPRRPAVLLLHHHRWWRLGKGNALLGGLFHMPAAEAQLGVFAQVCCSLQRLVGWQGPHVRPMCCV
jgi:hypothetical protein